MVKYCKKNGVLGPLRDHVTSSGLTLRKTAHFDKSGVINTDFLSATESAKNKP